MVLPKRSIDISAHAHHRAVSRFGLSKGKATHAIRKALRSGKWYPSPDGADEYLVLQRIQRKQMCVICVVETGTVHVRTIYPLTNPGQLSAYKRTGGPFSASEIAAHYGIRA